MLIIIEGPDCSKKSTLTWLLAEHLAACGDVVDVIHRGPPTLHPLDEYELPLLDYRPGGDHNVVCDRWHLGEAVYPAVFGRPTRLDDAVFRHVELFLRSRGAFVVVITPELDELRACLQRRGDDVVQPEQLEAIRAGFVDVTSRSGLPLLWLKDERVDAELVRQITYEAELVERNSSSYVHDAVTYVGPRWPHLLLLGDVRNTGTDPGDLRPAFMPYPATSGHYIFTTLGDVLRDGVGVANACDVDDPHALWNALGRPETVTLGRSAERTVTWPARHAPHPQWQRRFHHHERRAYAQLVLGRVFHHEVGSSES